MPSSTRKAQPSPTVPPQDPSDKYAASAWGSGGNTYEDLTFPSGQLALVRRPGVEGLMSEGLLHNLDTLTPLLEGHKAKANGKRPKQDLDISMVLKNPAMLIQMTHLLDRVLCACVVKPDIVMTPNDVTSRKKGVVYADMVDLDDKLFLFNYAVGGTRDLERFRRESAAALGGVPAQQADEGPA